MSAGVLRLDTATQTTSIPTQTTMTVMLTGTMMFRSNHSGRPSRWNPPLDVPLPWGPPNGGANVPENKKTAFINTFNLAVLAGADDAYDDNGDDNDGDGGDDGHDEVGVGEEVHPHFQVESTALGAEDGSVLPHLTGRTMLTYTKFNFFLLYSKIMFEIFAFCDRRRMTNVR